MRLISYYTLNNSSEFFEMEIDSTLCRSFKAVALKMAKEIYVQSCGEQPFPITLNFYGDDKKHIAKCVVEMEMEPSFFAYRIES